MRNTCLAPKDRNLDISDTVENAVCKLEFLTSVFEGVNTDIFMPSTPALTGLCDILQDIITSLNTIDGMWEPKEER